MISNDLIGRATLKQGLQMSQGKENTPSSIVNLGPVNYIEDSLDSPDYYRTFGLSSYASKCLAKHNKSGYPIEEFYWLDRKWLRYFSGENQKVLQEVRELLGGFFINLSVTDQCNLLEIPFFEGLPALASSDTKSRKKWSSLRGLVTPEECVEEKLTDYFELVMNDEGEHLRGWQIILGNMLEEARELNGQKRFPADWGSQAQKTRQRNEIAALARGMSEERFFSLMEEQIATQIRGSWWQSKYNLKQSMCAARSWGKERLIEIFESNQYLSGIPDLMLYDGNHHTLLEVKTRDRMHQSQAHFIRNTQKQLDLDICLVILEPADEIDPQLYSDTLVEFIEWVRND